MTRLERLAFNSSTMEGFVSEVIKMDAFDEDLRPFTKRDLRELWKRVHEEKDK